MKYPLYIEKHIEITNIN